MKHRFLLHALAALALSLAGLLTSCHSTTGTSYAPAPPAASRHESADTAPMEAAAMEVPSLTKSRRPGLGTQAGSDRYSTVNEATFFRKPTGQPDAVDSFHYNDKQGAEAMAGALGGGKKRSGEFAMAGGRVKVALHSWTSASPLPRLEAGGRRIVIGQPGEAYTMTVENETDHQIEVVASVDGLDVMDGGTASVRKRGYVIPKKGSLSIDGFRKDATTVRRFMFSSVDESAAGKAGKPRNVGVIGLAVYDEDEAAARAAQLAEAQKRQDAQAFPGR